MPVQASINFTGKKFKEPVVLRVTNGDNSIVTILTVDESIALRDDLTEILNQIRKPDVIAANGDIIEPKMKRCPKLANDNPCVICPSNINNCYCSDDSICTEPCNDSHRCLKISNLKKV